MTETRTAIGKNQPLKRDTLSTVLRLIADQPDITNLALASRSGYDPARIRSLLSWMRAMNLVETDRITLTPEGALLAAIDPHLHTRTALAFCYAALAGDDNNRVWFDIVNNCVYPCAMANLPVLKETALARPLFRELVTEGRSEEQVGKEFGRVFTTLTDQLGFGPLNIINDYDGKGATPGQFAPSPWLVGAVILRSLRGDSGTCRLHRLFDAGGIARLFMLSEAQVNSLLEALQSDGVLFVEHSAGLDRFYPKTLEWQELLRKAIQNEIGA